MAVAGGGTDCRVDWMGVIPDWAANPLPGQVNQANGDSPGFDEGVFDPNMKVDS